MHIKPQAFPHFLLQKSAMVLSMKNRVLYKIQACCSFCFIIEGFGFCLCDAENPMQVNSFILNLNVVVNILPLLKNYFLICFINFVSFSHLEN